jgi:sporulation protein YlmC with PRC-barrel domain
MTTADPGEVALPPREEMRGMPVMDRDGAPIGTVDDIYVDLNQPDVRYLAIATGLTGNRRHIVPIEHVALVGTGLRVPYEAEQVRQSPAYEVDTELTAEVEDDIYRHYGRMPYYEAVRARQSTPAPTPEIAAADMAAGSFETHKVRSVEELQTPPAATPQIAAAEAEEAMARGEDPNVIRVRRWR